MNIHTVSPKTIHVIGDSHALAFKHKSISLPDLGMIFSANVSYIRGLQPDTILPNGKLNSGIAQFLINEGLISSDGRPAALTNDPAILSEHYATGECFQTELVVFNVGEIYVRKYLGTLSADDLSNDDKIESDFRSVIETYVGNISGMRRAFGLRVCIHELTPPTADDEVFKSVNKIAFPRKRRGEVYKLFNALLAQYTAKAGVNFCHSNDYLADETGCLNADYEFDGVHADPKYSLISMARVVKIWLYSRTSDSTLRYNTWNALVNKSKLPAKISQIGVTEPVLAVDDAQIKRLRNAVRDLDYFICTRPNHDWGHAPPDKDFPKFKDVIKYGSIGPDGLELLHEVLVTGSIGDSIRSLIGSKFAIINVRPVESTPHDGDGVGQQAFHRDNCPPSIFRGLLYLVDVEGNEGGFEYKPVDGSDDPVQVVGKAGSWILFDANAVDHRASPPRTKTRLALDFIILAIPDEADEIVHCADRGIIWPVDPYMFSLGDLCYPPSKTGKWFFPSLISPKKDAP